MIKGWHKASVELQHKILDRMRNLGMMPILPGFNGYVPKAFVDKHKVNYTEQVTTKMDIKKIIKYFKI